MEAAHLMKDSKISLLRAYDFFLSVIHALTTVFVEFPAHLGGAVDGPEERVGHGDAGA